MPREGFEEFLNARVVLATDGVEFVAFLCEVVFEFVFFFGDPRFIAFIEDDDLRFLSEFLAEEGEFVVEFIEVIDGVSVGFSAVELVGDFDEMDEDSRAFEVFEEVESESFSLACADDESRDVSDDEADLVVNEDDTEIWNERSEGVVGDFGFCV